MPRYAYRCSACRHVYEKREGFDALSVQECPDCLGVARRVLTPPALVFKGSGFYVTDNRKKGSGSDQGDTAEKPAAAESGSGTEKSETKTETAAPTPAAASSSAPAAQAAAAD